MKSTAIIAIITLLISFRPSSAAAQPPTVPPDETDAKAALNKSPRHGEWADIAVPGQTSKVRSFVVYPERKDKAPIVIVIQEIYGLSDWIRAVADQLAADGFIAIAPDLLSGKGPNGGGTESFASRDDVVAAVRTLTPQQVMATLDAVREYGIKLPAANGKSATVGFCWGGGMSFAYAAHQPSLNAAVVYYGTPPDSSAIETIKAPVLGLYGGDDARVTATVGPADQQMKKLGKMYIHHIYPGAGHGFLRAQDARDGANLNAARQAWPETIRFLREQTK
jgi:carboxymethylenebutenolidase